MEDILNKRIFITGVYGVGKSTLCRELSKRFRFEYLKSSYLIYEYLKKQPPKDKRISDIGGNQNALIKALRDHVSMESDQILEGHTCLLNEQNVVKRIPEEVFDQLDLSGIILVTRDIFAVSNDLCSRDGIRYNVEVLEKMQQEETVYTQILSQRLDIPLLRIQYKTVENVENDEKIRKISEFFRLK